MFRSVRLQNFKAFEDFTVHLDDANVIVGVNNAGKSTILDAFRALAGALKVASRYKASLIEAYNGCVCIGYNVPMLALPLTIKNIHTDYREEDTTLTFTLRNKRVLRLLFPSSGWCKLVLDASLPEVSTIRKFKVICPIAINIIPTLGPFEEEENYLSDNYFEQIWQSRRSHRHFRNIWIRQEESLFEALNEIVAATWPAMSLRKPEMDGYGPAQLVMFCEENRRLREVYWAGFGFQIWVQFLTHLLLAQENAMLIVDEPDIYLHPELQRKLYNLLLQRAKQFVLATHSSEIINEADPDAIVAVDRSRRSGQRIRDVDGLQAVLDRIGSRQNIYLTKLSHARKILFVEGQDFGLLRKFARKLGLKNLTEGEKITPVALGGFSNSSRVEDVAWGFEKVLRADIKIAVFLDRDYRCIEEVSKRTHEMKAAASHVVILERKEIENYLLCPRSISLAASHRKSARFDAAELAKIGEDEVRIVIDGILDDMKIRIKANLDDFRLRFFDRSSVARATVLKEGATLFEEQWGTVAGRLVLAPGKEILARINDWLQQCHGVSVTPAAIVERMRREDVGHDLCQALVELENFARA